MQEVDIIYNLLSFVNTTNREDMNYTIALTVIQNLDPIRTEALMNWQICVLLRSQP